MLNNKMKTQQKQVKHTKWSENLYKKAKERHNYIKVGSKRGNLYLSGAERRWKEEQYYNIIYSPDFRVVGSIDNIKNLLKSLGKTDVEIMNYVNKSYSKENHKTYMKESYEKELEELNNYKNKVKLDKTNVVYKFTLDDLDFLTNNLKQAVSDTKLLNSTVNKLPKRKGGRKVRTLKQRIEDLAPQKVLDVSNMDPKTMTGIRVINKPGNNSKKFGSDKIPVVSSNLENYKFALENIEGLSYSVPDLLLEYNNLLKRGM